MVVQLVPRRNHLIARQLALALAFFDMQCVRGIVTAAALTVLLPWHGADALPYQPVPYQRGDGKGELLCTNPATVASSVYYIVCCR